MSGTMHIVRKDAIRLRWLLALWIVVIVTRVAMWMGGLTGLIDTGPDVQALQQLSNGMLSVELLLTALIVVRLVHDEPLVGMNAFWLTRPYDRRALVRAKLLFVAVVLLVVPVLADLTTMALLGARTAAMATTGGWSVMAHAGSALAVMVVATLTPSLVVFVLAIVGILAGASMLSAAALAVTALLPDYGDAYTRPAPPDATSPLVMYVFYISAALAVVVFQYRHRRWRAATALAVAGLVGTMVVPTMWPWRFARGEEISPDPGGAGAMITHDPSWGTQLSDVGRFGRGLPRRYVNARLTLTGLRPQLTTSVAVVQATLRFPDGKTIESSQPVSFEPSEQKDRFEAVLGGARLMATREQYENGWTPLMKLTENEFAAHRGQRGRLDAEIDLYLQRTRELAVLPLTPGSAFDDGMSRLEVVGAQRRTGGRDITIRHWKAQPLIPGAPDRLISFALRHRGRREALIGRVEYGWSIGRANPFSFQGMPLVIAGGASGQAFGGGFYATTAFVRFPAPGVKAPPLEPKWLEEAEFVLLETVPAGVVTRRVTIDPFLVPLN